MKTISFLSRLSSRDGHSFNNWMNCRSGSLLLILISVMNTRVRRKKQIRWYFAWTSQIVEFAKAAFEGARLVEDFDIPFWTIFSQNKNKESEKVRGGSHISRDFSTVCHFWSTRSVLYRLRHTTNSLFVWSFLRILNCFSHPKLPWCNRPILLQPFSILQPRQRYCNDRPLDPQRRLSPDNENVSGTITPCFAGQQGLGRSASASKHLPRHSWSSIWSLSSKTRLSPIFVDFAVFASFVISAAPRLWSLLIAKMPTAWPLPLELLLKIFNCCKILLR